MDTETQVRATEPLRAEHRELLPHIHELAEVADAVGVADDATTWSRVAELHRFLAGHLAPHAHAEEVVLYPAVEAAMSAPGATATMSRDHVDVVARIDRLADELARRGSIDAATATRLRAELYGLHAVVALHFEKEEEIYLPILDASLRPEEADELFSRMEAAAGS